MFIVLFSQNCTSGFNVFDINNAELPSTGKDTTNVKADVSISEGLNNMIHPDAVADWLRLSPGTALPNSFPGLAVLQESIKKTPEILFDNKKECIVKSINDLEDISDCEILTFKVKKNNYQ